jgi:hypothetical protein
MVHMHYLFVTMVLLLPTGSREAGKQDGLAPQQLAITGLFIGLFPRSMQMYILYCSRSCAENFVQVHPELGLKGCFNGCPSKSCCELSLRPAEHSARQVQFIVLCMWWQVTDSRFACDTHNCMHVQYAFLGGGGGVIKKYKLPEGEFCHNMIQQQPGIINSLAISPEDVVVSGADDGSLWCAARNV